MTGSGTTENPYIIMNVDDLYSMSTIGNNETYFQLGADIDFNDTDYAENFIPINLNCRGFDGNGHIIRNVNYNNIDTTSSMFAVSFDDGNIEIDNLKIENIRLTGTNVFLFANNGEKCNISLTHCTFILNDMISLASTLPTTDNAFCIMHDHNITISANYCTFAIKAEMYKFYAVFQSDTLSCTQSSIEMDFVAVPSSGTSLMPLCSSTSVSDSYFFIKIRNNSSAVTNYEISSVTSIFSRSYFVIQELKSISRIYWYGSLESTCFYDKTVLSATSEKSVVSGTSAYSANLHGLTTEQCKDASYLRSIGFNCMAENEESEDTEEDNG